MRKNFVTNDQTNFNTVEWRYHVASSAHDAPLKIVRVLVLSSIYHSIVN